MTKEELLQLSAENTKNINNLHKAQLKTDAQLAKTDAQLAKTDPHRKKYNRKN